MHHRLSLIYVFIFICFQVQDYVECQSTPVFTTLPKDNTVVEKGKDLTLPCSANGSPTPKIVRWLINNKPVNSNIHLLRNNGDLLIQRAFTEDAGDYQCVASNSLGGVASEKRKIIVAFFDKLPYPTDERVEYKVNQYFIATPPAVKCAPKPKYVWTKNGVPVVETDRLSISAEGELVISNLQSTDGGSYQLVIENTFLKNKGVDFASQKAKVVVLGVYDIFQSDTSKVIFSSKKQFAGEKRTPLVTLECFASGLKLDRIEITWKKLDKNGYANPVPESSKYIRRDNNRRLDIKEPTFKDDNGVFQCSVIYGFSVHDSKNVELSVHSVPNFLLKPKNVVVYTDNSSYINCTSSAFPEQTRRWYRNGIPVVGIEISDTYIKQPLFLKNLNWEDDGLFQCGAENFAGLFFLQVEVKVKNQSAAIVNVFKDVYVANSTLVSIPCVAIGAPKPIVYWLVNATRLTLPSAKYSVLENGTLQINDMQVKDGGRYSCVANNKINIVEKGLNVAVINPTTIAKGPQKETLVRKGSNINLPCEVNYDKGLNYTREWRQNNLPVTNKRYVVMQDGSLQIRFTKLIDTGIVFSCHIFSKGGNLSVFTTIILFQLPLVPSSPRPSEVQAYGLRLTWDAPSDGGSPLIGYKLFMKNHTMTSYYLLASLLADSTSYYVQNLKAGSKYRFKVSAANKFGVGDSSDETKWIETQTLAPLAAPHGFQAVSSEMDSVMLAWVIPDPQTHNGVLQGYYIDYRVSGSTQGFGRFDVIGGEKTSFKMNNLPEFTRYEVKIATYNKAGQSDWSSIQFVETKQGVPSASPTNVSVSVINDTAVYVSFDSPPQELWNGKLTYIVARTWPPGRPQDQSRYQTSYDSSSLHHQTFVLPNLKADTEYTLAVVVGTTGGDSKGSSFVQFKTSEGVPDAIRNLQVSGIYSDAFSVRWMVPSKPAGVIQGFQVRYRTYGFGEWKILKEPATALGAVITPLKPRTRYEVKVAAYTSKGVGTFVGASVQTIESPELPSAPSNLKAYAIYGNNISLGWIPGDSGRAVILYYVIEYNNDTAYHIKTPEAAIWRTIRNLTKILENPANLTHLKPSTTYRFRMTAFNRVGGSPISNISDDITTSEGVPSKAPSLVSATSPERQTLLVTWVPPPKETWNSGSIKYQFLIKPKGEDDEKIKTPYMEHQDTQATSYFVRGLRKFTLYNITLRLFNDKGFGPWTEPIFVGTSEDYPAGAPAQVKVKALDSQQIEVTWGPVPKDQRNGVILGYIVYYMILSKPETELFKRFNGNTTFKGVLSALAGYTDYEVRLMAYTKVGGIYKGSPHIVKTLEGVPGIPRDIRFTQVTYDFVTVQWSAPARPNGDIIGYDVRYRRNTSNSQWIDHQEQIQLFAHTARVRGLVFNSYYVFEIRARSVSGRGDYAREFVLITTNRQLPQSPIILTIPLSSVLSKSIIVKWLPRYDGNSPIRAYNLEYNEEIQGWKAFKYGIPSFVNIPAGLNEIEVKNLSPSSRYQFRIRAINDVGSSTWSEYSKIRTTRPLVPKGAPSNIRVVKKTQTSLFISWDVPEFTGFSGALRGYKISYKRIGGISDPSYINIPKTQTSLQISNLRVFSQYEVKLGAFSDNGERIWTQPYLWRTGEAFPLYAPYNVKVISQGASKIRVTWVSPDDDSVKGYKLGFKVESVRLLATNKKRKRRSLSRERRDINSVCQVIPPTQTHLAGPYSTELTLSNLLKYSQYKITVRVYNSFGDGPKSEIKTFQTPADVPGPPYLLSVRVFTKLIDLDFDAPCEPNGIILGYRIEYRERTNSKFTTLTYDRQKRRVRISGLKILTDYILELSARTSVGYGKKATIDFFTKGSSSPPKAPGAPDVYENKAGILRLKWDERDNGHMPVDRFYLQYRKGSGNWIDFRTIGLNEVQYDGSTVVYTITGLKENQIYRFRVKSQTALGTSPFSLSSKPIKTALFGSSAAPFYEEIWFIFVIIIIFLILLIIILVCCYKRRSKQAKYKHVNQPYNLSSFERAMVNSDTEGSRDQRNGSLAPSVASSKRPLLKNDSGRTSSNSIAKSVNPSDKSADTSDVTYIEARNNRNKQRDSDSIANHYSNDPFHKNWRDSMDKKTKKAILAEYKKRPSSQGSTDTLGEKKRSDSEELLNRPRIRPGRTDMTERKKLARSEPFLAEQEAPIINPRNQPQQVRRPGKRVVNPELTRSVPDLNRSGNQISRQPSFLRATMRDSDNESLNEILDKEKSKRELAMEYETRMDDFYPHAPPPYDYNGAPPAYSPSQQDDMSDGGRSSNFDFPVRNKPYYPPPPRLSESSDASRKSSRGYPPPQRSIDQPDRGGYHNPGLERTPKPKVVPPPIKPKVVPPPIKPKIPAKPKFVQSPRRDSPDLERTSNDGFAPPQNSKFDDEYYEDGIEGFEPDMTLV